MFTSPVTYLCIVFFLIMSAAQTALASDVSADSVYCKVEAHKFQRGEGFLGFLKRTFSCEVKVEYEIEEVYLDGSTNVEVSFEDGATAIEKIRGWLRED